MAYLLDTGFAVAMLNWRDSRHKVSTHVFAPEAQRRLAGDEGFAESPEQREI